MKKKTFTGILIDYEALNYSYYGNPKYYGVFEAAGVPVRLWAGYSQTTQRHINAFLDFYGLSQYIGKANTQKIDLVEA